MSQYPPPPPGQYPPPPGQYPPPPPVGYASAYVRPPDPRPTSVKVIAVLAIIFGSLGVLAGLCSIPQYLGVQMTPSNPNPVIDAMREDKLLWGATVATMVASIIIAAVELICGIGALKLRPWGRRGLVAYAVANIIVTLLGLVLQFTVFQARSDRILAEVLRQHPQLNTPAMATAMRVGKTTGVVFPVIFVVWASIVLYFMTRLRVKEAFEGRGSMG